VSASVMGQGMRLVVLGVLAGAVLALLLTRWIASQLYAVSAHDPAVFGVVSLALLGVAALASWLPALRAARIDPQIALRSE
ncbi:MAG: hypothetical protein DMD26_14920, partial [Gemmatimonadetes bacterium]